jgi:hypothetical protein
MNIRQLQRGDDHSVIQFLDACGTENESVLAYHYPFYRDMLLTLEIGEDYYLGLFDDSNNLTGYLPGFIKQSNLGSVFCSLPYFGPNAGIILDKTTDQTLGHNLLIHYLLAAFPDDRGKLISASIYTPFHFDKFELYEFNLPSDFLTVDRKTQYLHIPDAKWNAKIDYDIRKAEKEGVRITNENIEQNFDQFYNIYLQNCNEFSIPVKPREAVWFLATEGIRLKKVTLDFAFFNGNMVGALMMLFGPITASYYLPCQLAGYRYLQTNTLLINQAIKNSISNGIHYWNWESSPSDESGVFKFKKKWGSLEFPYKIYTVIPQGKQIFKETGQLALSKTFPFFFVIPFQCL